VTAVQVRPGEGIDGALRRFKKVVEAANTLSDVRAHEHYVKPSVARKRKSMIARKRRSA